jgi:hypothetical protein
MRSPSKVLARPTFPRDTRDNGDGRNLAALHDGIDPYSVPATTGLQKFKWSRLLRENVEKVVNPPRMPVVRNNRHAGLGSNRMERSKRPLPHGMRSDRSHQPVGGYRGNPTPSGRYRSNLVAHCHRGASRARVTTTQAALLDDVPSITDSR